MPRGTTRRRFLPLLRRVRRRPDLRRREVCLDADLGLELNLDINLLTILDII